MATEGANWITELDTNNPPADSSGLAGDGDDQHRQTKAVLQNQFQGGTFEENPDPYDTAVTVGPRFLNSLATTIPDYDTNVMRKDVAGEVAVEHTFNAGLKLAQGTNIQSDNDAQVIGVGGSDEIAIGSGTPVTIQDSSGQPTVSDGVDSSPILTVKNVADLLFPVGSIYLTAGNANPANRFPGTVWTQISKGKFLVGVGSDTRDGVSRTYSAGEDEFGEYMHRLTESEMPPHTHSVYTGAQLATQNVSGIPVDGRTLGQTGSAGGESGVTSRHENCPPAYGIYVWRRDS